MGWLMLMAAPFIGSFLGVLIRRMPRDETVISGRSHCEHCGKTLSTRELVPLLSHLYQHGVCRGCGGRIDPFHPAIELAATAMAAAAIAIHGAGSLWIVGDCILGWSLLALAWIDIVSWRLPDTLTLPLLLAGLGEALWLDPPALLWPRLTGIIAGWLSLSLVAWIYRALRGRDGLGGGDPKLFAAGAAWTGIEALPDILLGAAACGVMYALFLASRGRRLEGSMALPFGPCLAAAIWVMRLAME